jgi:hypothetical protein
MDCSPAEFDVNVVCPEDQGKVPGFLVDLGSLYDYLARLEDRRDPRGVRYRLVHILLFVLLVFVLLGKLAGEDRLTGIAEWVWHRKEALAQALGLPRPQAPHRTTYRRVLGATLSVEALERTMGECLAQNRTDGQLAMDGWFR